MQIVFAEFAIFKSPEGSGITKTVIKSLEDTWIDQNGTQQRS